MLLPDSALSSSAWAFELDFVPPFRFAMVENGVFRGAYPTLRNFPFLKRMKIKTILSLTPEEATFDLKEFAKAEKVQLRYIQAERHKGDPQLLPSDLNDALHLITNAEMHPIYIHCLDGRHVIGLVVMALRKLQCWDYASMQFEYERFARESNNETAFISDYGGGLTLPVRLPAWLWGGSWLDADNKPRKHPTLKVKYAASTLGTASSTSANSTTLLSPSSATSSSGIAAKSHVSSTSDVLSSSANDLMNLLSSPSAAPDTKAAGDGRATSQTSAAAQYIDLSSLGSLHFTLSPMHSEANRRTAPIAELQSLSVRCTVARIAAVAPPATGQGATVGDNSQSKVAGAPSAAAQSSGTLSASSEATTLGGSLVGALSAPPKRLKRSSSFDF